jgi:hypothetical protein
MPFNLKNHAKPVAKMLQEQHEELGGNEQIGTTNRLLEPDRKNKDNSLISTELEKTHKGEAKGLTEQQMDDYAPGEGLSKRTGQDTFDQLPINLLEEKRQQEYARDYKRAQDIDPDTEFWDDYITEEIGQPTSQLHNHHDRFRSFNEADILKNEGVRQMVTASLVDADAMIYHLFRSAADKNRELTADEKKLLVQLSSEKAKVLARLAS